MSDYGSDNEDRGFVVTSLTTKEELFNELVKASTKEELEEITNNLAAQMDAIRNERSSRTSANSLSWRTTCRTWRSAF